MCVVNESGNEIKKANRNSRIELLRIIAMTFIVWGHLIGQGAVKKHAYNQALFVVSAFMGSGSRIAVNVFLIIGVYFMIDRTLKVRSILKYTFGIRQGLTHKSG